MTRRRRLLLVGLAALAVLLVGGTLVVHRLLFTTAGLDFVLRQLDRLQTVRIEVSGARGVLAGPLAAERIVVDHEAVHIEARGLRVHPQWYGAMTGLVSVEDVVVDDLEIRLKEREKQPESETHFLPAWLRLSIPGFAANRVALVLADGTRYAVRRIEGSAHINRWRIVVKPAVIDDPLGRISGEVVLRGTNPLGLQAKAQGRWRLADARTYQFTVAVRGDLDRLGADFELQQPARLAFAGNLLELTDQPRVVGTLRLVDFDGAPWLAAGTLPALTGSVALFANATSIGLDGTLTSPSLEAGPLRLQGGGGWRDRQLRVASLRAWLPRVQSELTTRGTVSFAGERPELALEGDWKALRWPLTGAAEVESRQGRFTLAGELPYSFTVVTDVRGPVIPAADFEAAGSFDTAGLQLDRIDGRTLRGRLEGSGRLAWAGTQAWQFRIAGRGLDISQLRPQVRGRINVAGSVEGQGFAANAPWTARISALSGTLFDRALTGRGEIAHRDGTYELRQVRISNGASHVDIEGRYGATMDLRWDANLQSLAIVAPDLAGQLVSSGHARGTVTRPDIVGEAHLRNLRYAGTEVGTADAVLDVDASDHRASRIELRARDASAGALRIDEASLRVSGLVREHDIDVELVSPGTENRRLAPFRGSISARGGYDAARTAWAGNLDAATVAFADGQAKLLQPAALDLGPDLLRSSPLCIASDEARLCLEGEYRPQPESWRIIYSAQDWPLRRLLSTMLGWQEFNGNLQASGWTEKAPGGDWVGGTTLLLDHPSVDIPRNKFRKERIELGAGRLDVYAEPEQLRANLDLALTEASQIRGEVIAERRRGADLLTSPMHGGLRGESANMRWLPLVVPEIDRASGRLDGELVVGGTLGEPRFNGDFRIRDGKIDMYRTNLSLGQVQLDGNFIGDELTFVGRGETARGPVTLDGRFSWPQGVMTGAMHLKGDNLLVADTPEYRVVASPNLTLQAGPDGYLVEGEIVVPTARISPKDLSTSVSTSPDEKVVNIEVEDNSPAAVQRVRSRIRVVLGDNVRVESYGLKARLGGEVTVLTQPDDVARGLGAIEVLEGQYKAFGQDVKITKGKLSYNNTPLGEPQLELTAERTIKDEDITVAVNVRGSLARPFITISSTPAMSSNEALSYLLTGRSIDTLQSSEASNVNKAAENLAVSGGGLLLGGLGSKLGLDELSLERTGEEDTSVTLGKFLSPKLFVSYGVSIAESINTIKLRYTLNKRWSLKAEAGLEQSADIEYKIER